MYQSLHKILSLEAYIKFHIRRIYMCVRADFFFILQN